MDNHSSAGPEQNREHDIEELRKKLEQAIQQEQRFRTFIDNASDYAFITFDRNNAVTSWNAGAERILGYSAAEIIGQSGFVFFTREDVAAGEHLRELNNARTQGRAEDERWHLRKDGTRFWGSGVMMALREPADDVTAEIRGFGKILRDLTDRKQAQERLRESEERFRLLVSNVTECALFQVDAQGNISSWNPGAERAFGYSEEDILGRSVEILFPPDESTQRRVNDELQRTPAEVSEAGGQWVVRKDGTKFFARWTTDVVRDSNGTILGFIKVLRDETALKIAEEERRREQERLRAEAKLAQMLDRSKEDLGALAARLMVAHDEERRRIALELHDDLSQRLAMLDISVALLYDDLPNDRAKIRAELKRLQRETAFVSESLRRLSDRLHPFFLEDLGLEVAIRRLAEDVQRSGNNAVGAEIGAIPVPIPRSVAGAAYRIAQEALRNVAKHAAGAPVKISLSVHDGYLHLSIEDEGPGFDLVNIRDKRGIGLINMQERAQLAGGTIEIMAGESGVNISVALPLGDQ